LAYTSFLISIPDARALFERVIPTFPPERARPLWERWARYEYQYGDLEAAQKLEKRIAEVYPSGMSNSLHNFFSRTNIDFINPDPPIKLFAQRHMYLGLDAIAARDLGFAMARKVANGTGALGRSETQQSLVSTTPAINLHKRPSSPDYRKREERSGGSGSGSGGGGGGGDYSQGHKRPRPLSPVVRDRERDGRWDGPPRRRFSPPPPPSWERESRDRPPLPPPRIQEREEEKPRLPTVPPVISWFIGELPSATSFDGKQCHFVMKLRLITFFRPRLPN
jgi:cleavage stimulation factor subunit 3